MQQRVYLDWIQSYKIILQLYRQSSFRTQRELRTTYKKSYVLHLSVSIRCKGSTQYRWLSTFCLSFSSPNKVLWELWHLPRAHDKLLLFPARHWGWQHTEQLHCDCRPQPLSDASELLNPWFHFILVVPRQGVLLPILLDTSVSCLLSLRYHGHILAIRFFFLL